MPPEDNGCGHAAIPNRLHRNGRPANQVFEPDEQLYRRCYAVTGPLITESGEINDRHFSTKEMSLNRNKFSDGHEDVLWNTNTGVYESACGVLGFSADGIAGQSFEHPEGKKRYVLTLEHNPDECMHPHTVVIVVEEKHDDAGAAIESQKLVEEGIRPGTVRRDVRKFFAARSAVLREIGGGVPQNPPTP